MLHIADRSRTQQSRTRWFLVLSLLLHGLAVVVLNVTLLPKDEVRPPPKNPIRVSFAPPEKVEEPQRAEVFAEASSRVQSPEGPRAEVAKDSEAILPKPIQPPSEPSPPSPPRLPRQAQPAPQPRRPAVQPLAREAAIPPEPPPVKQPAVQPRRQERARSETPPPPPAPKPSTERPESKRFAKLPEPAERAVPAPEVQALPPSQPAVESPPESEQNQPRLLGRIPLLSGDDLEKYARVRASDQRTSSGDTVSLDTKELKYLSYFAHIKRRIERVWTYPPEAIADGLQGQLHLKFVLRRNGQVKTVELLRSSGSKVLDKEAWDAVVNAGPFNPFPPLIPEDELHITARFTYVLDEALRRTRVR
jgi:protein TonB